MRPSVPTLCVAALLLAACASDETTAPAPPPAPEPVDSVAPVIVRFTGPGQVALGGVFTLELVARDSVRVKGATLSFSGGFEASRWFDFKEEWNGIPLVFTVQVPFYANPELPVIATMTVSDGAGNTAEAQIGFGLKDTTRPFVTLHLGGLHYDETIRTGETLELYVNAGDNHRLRYIGYQVGTTRDSVLASGTGDSHVFYLTVPPSWRIQRPVFIAWARDASGNGTLTDTTNVREIPVYDWVDRPIQTYPLPPETNRSMVLWDEKRNAIYRLRYLSNWSPESPRIDGAYLEAGVVLPSIALPTMPQSFAFTPSGDSLLVTLYGERTLGIVDLLQPVRTLSTIPLQYQGEQTQYGELLRDPIHVLATGNRVFVTLVFSEFPSRLLDIDLATGQQVVRADFSGVAWPALLPLPDGRVYIGPETSGSFTQQVIYSPASNTFSTINSLRPASVWQFAPSPSGRFMLGGTLYNASLDSIATVRTQDWKEDDYGSSYPAALSADGTAAFLTTHYGYEKVRVADGFLLEQVKLGVRPQALIATADGTRLIAITASAVKVIDLR